MKLIGTKLGLKKGMTVLDIGCGWGTLSKFLAKEYDVKIVGVTLAKEQVKYYNQNLNDDPRVEIVLSDYRIYFEKAKKEKIFFDRIVSVGFFEHVGLANYDNLFSEIKTLLKDDTGLCLIQTIGMRTTSNVRSYTYLFKKVFPYSMLPSNVHIDAAVEKSGMIIEDWQNRSDDYRKTLICWIDSVQKQKESIIEKYGEEQYRHWLYYLGHCAAEFKARRAQSWQIVMSKAGILGGYYVPLQ
jgi:cyclopropane-fatty-acyl-phospholipid synthase